MCEDAGQALCFINQCRISFSPASCMALPGVREMCEVDFGREKFHNKESIGVPVLVCKHTNVDDI